MAYVSPYGKTADLPARLAGWVGRMSNDKSLPWAGLGIIHDLEHVLRLLTLPEFGQWLAAHADDELQQWGSEVLDAADARDELVRLSAVITDELPATGETYERDVAAAGKTLADMRAVLVEAGALSADDAETPLPDLMRALLS